MVEPQIIRPIPRRAFDFGPTSPDESESPSPELDNAANDNTPLHMPRSDLKAPSRTKSILNLTSSTLLGIYSGATDGQQQELHTPWGTGAQTPLQTPLQTPSQRPSMDIGMLAPPAFPFNTTRKPSMSGRTPTRKGFRHYYLPLFFQTVMLFGFGTGFGVLITQLHRTQHITPVPVPANRSNPMFYQLAWGLLGVLIGNTLPQIDIWFEDEEAIAEGFTDVPKPQQHIRTISTSSQGRSAASESGPLWHPAVRSIGAFMGIALALRKIPWQSTLQVSLTLAIANPVLWYLIDRSRPGFLLSLAISMVGTFVSLLVNPNFVPLPDIYQQNMSDKMGTYVWLASILFCTSLCFGAIGRRLQL